MTPEEYDRRVDRNTDAILRLALLPARPPMSAEEFQAIHDHHMEEYRAGLDQVGPAYDHLERDHDEAYEPENDDE